MARIYVDANSLLLDSYKLANKIYKSKYKVDLMISTWRGASLVTLAID